MGSFHTTNKKQEDFIPNEKFSGELKEKDIITFKSETENDIKNNKGQVIEYPSLEEINEMNKLFDDNRIECPICLEPYTESSIKKKITCGHCFCYICISKAIQILPLCPLCRKNIDYNKEFTNLTENEGINLDISQKRMEESKEISSATTSVFPTQNWNVHTLRNILSNDNDFTRQNNNFFQNRFQNDRLFKQAGMVAYDDPFFKSKNVFDSNFFQNRESPFEKDPFFISARKNFENRKNNNKCSWGENAFNSDFNSAFNDPFFKNSNHNSAFNDPFFKNPNHNSGFNDPFFKNSNHNSAFNDPFFNNSNHNSAFNDPFFKNKFR